VTLEMVSVSLGKYTVAIALSLVPLTLVNVFVGVDHTAFTLRHTIDPVTVITVAIFVEECASAVLLVFKPIASVFTSQLFGFHAPVSTLSMTLVKTPHTFVLVTRLVVLDAETFLAVIAPVSDILGTANPLVSLDGTVFACFALLNPKYSSVSSIFLSFGVIAIQGVTTKVEFTFSRSG